VSSTAILLQMHGIAKRFGGVHALRGIDFELRAGEVHALLGENGAGKSTLMNVLSGVVTGYEGTLEVAGRPLTFAGPADAQAAGIATIHQELDLVRHLTVAENLFLGREPRTRLRLLDRRAMYRSAGELLTEVGIDLSPDARVGSLRVGEQQLVEIAKALSLEARILVMDEPTSALTDTEVDRLFGLVRELRRRGVGVVYISHRLEEIAAIADRATVLRDGRLVGTVEVAQTPAEDLIGMMVGQPIEQLFPDTGTDQGEPMLVVHDLRVEPRRPERGRSEPAGIDLTVRAGEIVGLAGLMGAGRTELMDTLFGAGPPGTRHGTVTLGGEPLEPRSPKEAIAAGVGYVPEDRRGAGLVMVGSVGSNISLAALRDVATAGVVRRRRERTAVSQSVEDLRIKTSSAATGVGTLSGGNQQKVVFARHLLHHPRLLLLDEPTRGVDVGAKAEIYRLLADLAAQGMAVLVASSELPELLGLCDRIVVLRVGRVAAELDGATATQESILAAANLPAAGPGRSADEHVEVA